MFKTWKTRLFSKHRRRKEELQKRKGGGKRRDGKPKMRRDNDRRGLLQEGREAQEGEGGVWVEELVALHHLRDMLDLVGKVPRVASAGACHRPQADRDLELGGESEAPEEEAEQSNEKLFV